MENTLIETLLNERPRFHLGETEIQRPFELSESTLPPEEVQGFKAGVAECYGIDSEVAHFLASCVKEPFKSLEIGAGLSTLILAIKGSQHVSVTPNAPEIAAIRQYAAAKQIDLTRVRFVVAPSDQFLPTTELTDLDLVFIDGKHAFPWPIVDWFYSADRLKEGGVMILDDTHMISGRILVDFMTVDPRWKLKANFHSKTVAFQKIAKSVHDVAWHMQPFIVDDLHRQSSLVGRIVRKFRSLS